MTATPHDEFLRRLALGRNGGAILFCGAGFSADCLNFKPDETLGTGAQLLNLFNSELEQNPPFRDLRNAADQFWERGEHNMEQLLKEKYAVAEVTTDMVDLLRYPWKAIYTTNYDDALEKCADVAGKRAESFNNADRPQVGNTLPIIHLHGYIHKWDIRNIRDSCVLGAESYDRLTEVKKWLGRFRSDIDEAGLVVFVGFNAGDIHLNQAIFDITGLQQRAFFINRPTAEADPDVAATQARFGTPFYFGRSGFASHIRDIMTRDAPKEPHLACFSKFEPALPATSVPTSEQIEDLFVFGKVAMDQMARDTASGNSDYLVQRRAMHLALRAIEDNKRVILFEGHPCDGKTLLTTGMAQRLTGARPVYRLRQPYESLLNEVSSILQYAPNASLIIENCFDLPPERLEAIARQVDGYDALLILTSRAVAVDASPDALDALERLDSFHRQSIEFLTDDEAKDLSNLVEQIAGWRDFRDLDGAGKLRFIQRACNGSLPNVLIRLLESQYVVERYKQEFSKLSLSAKERALIVVALYIAHIGENAPTSFLSSHLETDAAGMVKGLDRKAGNDTFRILRHTAGFIETVPSIGARNILSNLFEDREIVDTIAELVMGLARIYRDAFEYRIFDQVMRFKPLTDTVTSEEEMNRFYELCKTEPKIRERPLFWLQWHMAMSNMGRLIEAEKLLEQGYTEADNRERHTGKSFDRRQLHDRRAKFLMLRATTSERSNAELFRDFKEACDLTGKILRQEDPQHYPFETLKDIYQALEIARPKMLDSHQPIVTKWIEDLKTYAEKRLGMLDEGVRKNKARSALKAMR